MESNILEVQPSISQKDYQIFSRSFRKLCQLYYENTKHQDNVQGLINLTCMIMQIVKTREQTKFVNIISQMEILKAKAKLQTTLVQKIGEAVQHLRMPKNVPIDLQLLYKILDNPQLFSIGSIIFIRFFKTLKNLKKYEQKEIVEIIGVNITIEPQLALQMCHLISKNNEQSSKFMIKEGIVKYFTCNLVPTIMKDKLLLYKCIKFLNIIANSEKSIIKDRQNIIAHIIYLYQEYTAIISQILRKCYEESYCYQFAKQSKQEGINFYYLWSYNQYFCEQILSQTFIEQLIASTKTKMLSPQKESKYYAIIGNYCKYCKYYHQDVLKNIPSNHQSLLNYLKICLDFCDRDKNSFQLFQWNKIQILLEKAQSWHPHQLYKMLKERVGKESKVGLLTNKSKMAFSAQRNADLFHIKAERIPKNDNQLKELEQLLLQKDGKSDFDKDSLLMSKEKALQSIRTSILENNNLSLKSLIQKWQCNDCQLLSKFLQIIQLNLMMNEDSAKDININKLLSLFLWLQTNYKGQIIDWGCIGQIINIVFQEKQSLKHIKQIPEKCFWILGLQNLEENDVNNLYKAIQSGSKKDPKKIVLAIGFLGKKLQNKQKIQLLKKHKDIFESIIISIKNNKDYELNLMMMSYFINNWYQEEEKVDNKQFQALIQPLLAIVNNNYKALPQEHYFMQACLPYRLNLDKFTPLISNLEQLTNQYGLLSGQIYQNQCKNKKNYLRSDKLPALSQQNPKNLLEMLNFLDNHPELLNYSQYNKLMIKIKENKDSFWSLYPYYFDIMSSLINLLKTENSSLKPYNSQNLVTIIGQIQQNPDITKEEREDLFSIVKEVLEQFSKKGTYIEIIQMKKIVNKIIQEETQQEFIYILNNYKIKEEPSKKQQKKQLKIKPEIKVNNLLAERISLLQGQINKTQNKKQVKIIKINEQQIKNRYMEKQIKKVQILIEDLNIKEDIIIIQNQNQLSDKNVQFSNEANLINYEDQVLRKADNLKEVPMIAHNISIQEQFMSVKLAPLSKNYLSALETLRKIVNKEIPVSIFDEIYPILSTQIGSQLQKQLLGELLSQYYPMISDERALLLLLDKERTSLNNEIFYQLVRKHIKAFILVRRWHLTSRQGLDIAMKRIKEGFLHDACNVAAYNLLKSTQIQYFYASKYHLILESQVANIKNEEEYISFVYLVGKICKLPQIKWQYIKTKLYLKIMTMIKRFHQNSRAISTLCYAQSIFLQENQEIKNDLISLKEQNAIIYACLTKEYKNKNIVQPGCCYIANLSYGTDKNKEVLRQRKTIQLLLLLFKGNIDSQEHELFKQILRGMSNLSINKLCSMELIQGKFCDLANQMAQNLNFFAFYDEKKARIMKLLIDVINNISIHKTRLQIIFKSKIPLLIITILQTTQKNHHILCGCINTIDSLCQDLQIQEYFVKDKKLPYILNDFLKMQEEELILIKTIRLIANLTIHQQNIESLLKSNLFSVLGNIVMPNTSIVHMQQDNVTHIQNSILKMLIRIYQAAPKLQLILKSGYLDCLVRCIEIFHTQDVLINILFYYSEYLPSILNKRAFSCLIKIMILKINTMTDVDKCIISFKNLITFSYNKEDQEEVFNGIPEMYEKFLATAYLADALFLIVYHLLRSSNLRKQLRKKEYTVLQKIQYYCKSQPFIEIGKVIMFLCYNNTRQILFETNNSFKDEQQLYKVIKKGFRCLLYRDDGSIKDALVDIDDDFKIRAYKYPDGEVKKKYTFELSQLKDYQFDFSANDQLWTHSVFSSDRPLFDNHIPDKKLCVTLVGLVKWGEVYLLNIQFQSQKDKVIFYCCLKYLISIFRS